MLQDFVSVIINFVTEIARFTIAVKLILFFLLFTIFSLNLPRI
jgi:hypothetical protein